MLLKNVASQGVYLFAYTISSGLVKTGDAANITGVRSLDGASNSAFSTTNPTEIGHGIYWQPLSQAETNANTFAYSWSSSTSDVQIQPIIGYTSGVNLPVAAPNSNGGLPILSSSGAALAYTVIINQDTAITDRIDATIGGALAGAWATGWGKVVKDVSGPVLDVWGPTNVSGTPSIEFDLDDFDNPTTRTPP